MTDNYYPVVPISYILDQIQQSGKTEDGGIGRFGSTTTVVKSGTQAIHKRTIFIKDIDNNGNISLGKATALAIQYSFLSNLIKWLEDNKDWKEGAFLVKKNDN